MSKTYFTTPVRLIEQELNSDTVTDGDYDFPTDHGAPRTNIIDYFYFVDGSGNLVAPTAGTVVISFNPVANEDLYGPAQNGSFNAVDAASPIRAMPSGVGRITNVRVTLSGVTGAAGFRAMLSQS